MRKVRVEVYEETNEGPQYWYGKILLNTGWRGGAFFVVDSIRYSVVDDNILCRGQVVGRIADWGRTYFIGPKKAPTQREYLDAKFQRELGEADKCMKPT